MHAAMQTVSLPRRIGAALAAIMRAPSFTDASPAPRFKLSNTKALAA